MVMEVWMAVYRVDDGGGIGVKSGCGCKMGK